MGTSGRGETGRGLSRTDTYTRQSLAVLFVDPDVEHAERLARPLRGRCAVAIAASAREAMAAMRIRTPDLVVTELDLPDMSGLDFLAGVHSAPETRRVMLMVVTARAAVHEKIAAFQAGADDLLVKPLDAQQFEMHVYLLSRFRSIATS